MILSTLFRRLHTALLTLPLVGLVISLAGCRLYEPERYTRLTFSPGTPQTRVLMIGDSLTYYNDLPGLLQQLSARETAPISIESKTFPLRSLRQHLSVDNSLEAVRNGHFDYVVLQDFSDDPINQFDASLNSFLKFSDETRRAGGKTIIFWNWMHTDAQSQYPAMENAYQKIAQETHAQLAPIGKAWHQCLADHPEIKLYLDDRHPSDAGSYLTACVLYDVLYQKKSAALPAGLPGPHLPESTLAALRSVADRTVFGTP
jgi:hypothetical protein